MRPEQVVLHPNRPGLHCRLLEFGRRVAQCLPIGTKVPKKERGKEPNFGEFSLVAGVGPAFALDHHRKETEANAEDDHQNAKNQAVGDHAGTGDAVAKEAAEAVCGGGDAEDADGNAEPEEDAFEDASLAVIVVFHVPWRGPGLYDGSGADSTRLVPA